MGVRERPSQGNGFTSEDATYSDRKNRPLSCARPAARSEEPRSKEQGARSKEQGARSKDEGWSLGRS